MQIKTSSRNFFLVEIILKKQANTPKNRKKTGKQDKFEKTGKNRKTVSVGTLLLWISYLQ